MLLVSMDSLLVGLAVLATVTFPFSRGRLAFNREPWGNQKQDDRHSAASMSHAASTPMASVIKWRLCTTSSVLVEAKFHAVTLLIAKQSHQIASPPSVWSNARCALRSSAVTSGGNGWGRLLAIGSHITVAIVIGSSCSADCCVLVSST